MKSLRGQRLSSEYQKAVYEVISTKLKYKTDRIRGIVSVTKADVSPDLKNAKIYISVLAKDAEEAKATFAAINNYRLSDSEGEDSYNLLPAIRSEREIAPIREATVHHSIEGQFTIRQGDWKLLLSPSSGGWSAPTPTDTAALALLPPVQLYDMRVDPGEKNNVEADHPEVVDRLKNLLIKYIKEGRSTPGVPQRNDGAYPWKQLDWME